MSERFELTPAQEAAAAGYGPPIRQTESGVVVKAEDGKMLEIAPDGEVRDLATDVRPVPVDLSPDVIDGEAEELPAPDDDEGSPDAYRPPEVALAVDTRDPSDVYRAMDRADEELILDELMGRAIDTMVYSFNQDGKLLTDLTVSGVNETVRLMNERGGTQIGISNQTPIVDEFREGEKDYYRVLVFARDARFPESGRWGTAVEPKLMTLKSGKTKWDKFALTKALNKAQRNALRAFIPEDFRQHVIALYLGQGKVKELKPLGGGRVAELPPALQDEKADQLRSEIHEAYKELQSINRLRMPPARFNAFLTKAETDSHERMEAFRDQIRESIADEKRIAAEAAS